MYQGYRLKIDDTIVPNEIIARGTFSFQKVDRIIDSYEDEKGVTHEVVADKKRVLIGFSFKEHDSSEHLVFCRYINKKDNVSVEYYDDEENVYEPGIFKIEASAFTHRNVIGNNILYNSCAIKLTEY